MATNNFNSDPTNDSFEPLMSYFDSQGVNRLESANISSYGFDGFIPTVIQNRTASGILPGMAISLTGSSTGQNFYKVLSNNIGDREFTASPSNEIVIEYLDNDQLVQVLSASVNDIFSVSYENWDGKDLGTTGWYLGNSGNAIFSNVAVRGRIEAIEGAINGNLTLGGSLTASTNNGFLKLSSSGIFGSTASGNIIFNNITGKLQVSGNITANQGNIKQLLIGAGVSHSILNIVGTASVSDARHSGNFILTTDLNQKAMYPGNNFYINGSSASGIAFANSSPIAKPDLIFNSATIDADTKIWSSTIIFSVITASLNFGGSYNRYFCRRSQSGIFTNYDFSQLTASSGSINLGYAYTGEFTGYSGVSSPPTKIDGIIFNPPRSSNFWGDSPPDHIDLTGKFRLGGGRLTYESGVLTTSGFLKNSQKNVVDITASAYTLQSSDAWSRLDVSSTASTVIVIPVAFSAIFDDKTEIDFIQCGSGSVIFAIQTVTSASLNSFLNRRTLAGQWTTAKLTAKSLNNWILTGNIL